MHLYLNLFGNELAKQTVIFVSISLEFHKKNNFKKISRSNYKSVFNF